MPDLLIILCDGPVTGEHSCLGDIYQAFLSPSHRIYRIISQRLPFSYHISIEIRQRLEPVFADQFMMQTAQIFVLSYVHQLMPDQEIYCPADIGIPLIPLLCAVISCLITVDHLI